MNTWYYVQGSDRVGPVEESAIADLLNDGTLNEESYVWTKGFENWAKVNTVQELSSYINNSEDDTADLPPAEGFGIDWDQIAKDEKVFMIKIGLDRGTKEVEYGPYSMEELKRAYDEKRINDKTFVFVQGMESWVFLAELPVYQSIFSAMPPVIEEMDRRNNTRKPFVARLLFHDDAVVYEGVCRDISIGGMQILVSSFPGKIGDIISMNVHPENTDYNFVAKGEVVRILDGGQGFSLRFMDIGEDASGAINNYLSQH